MDIVMLAAGTSSRMGAVNKMLLPYGDTVLAAHCCMQALEFLKGSAGGRLVVVTGYSNSELERALEPCAEYVRACGVGLLFAHNAGYERGQFTSAKTGAAAANGTEPFFISLADMPLVTAAHYSRLLPLLEGFDAVRPLYRDEPGHPVLFAPGMEQKILSCPDSFSVNRLLSSGIYNVRTLLVENSSWVRDIDTPKDITSACQAI